MDWMTVIQNLGFPIACVVACGVFIYKLVIRDKDEAVEREKTLQQSITDNTAALGKVADTIEKSNEVNSQLAETNRLLVDKMEDKLTDIDENVHKILDNMNE
jgi:hypothetical protein